MSSNPGLSGKNETVPFSGGLKLTPTIASRKEAQHSSHGAVTAINQNPRARRARIRSLSAWSQSYGKRFFDLACVVGSLPVVLPVLLVTGVAVRLTSRGPVLFRQQRIGRFGRPFTILKFRTMPERSRPSIRPSLTTTANQRFTLIGRFLRRWKLDELPQFINVLRGEMSLVGPRPKLAAYQKSHLLCRPGITGRASLVFAREEELLAEVPPGSLDAYYHNVILPAKQMLDEEYMLRATLLSDLKLIANSVLGRWDDAALQELLLMQIQSQPTAQVRVQGDRTEKAHIAPILLTTSQKVPVTMPAQAD